MQKLTAPKGFKIWTSEEKKKLTKLAKTHSTQEIATIMNRPIAGVTGMLYRLRQISETGVVREVTQTTKMMVCIDHVENGFDHLVKTAKCLNRPHSQILEILEECQRTGEYMRLIAGRFSLKNS